MIQCPKVVYPNEVGIFRLAWLKPETIDSPSTMKRLEAVIVALEQVEDSPGFDVMQFKPPSLTSLRYDTLKKVGEYQEQVDDSTEEILPSWE